MPSDVEFSVCRGVSGCGWSISSNILRTTTPFFALSYSAASSALIADDITLRMLVDATCTTPLFIIGWHSFFLLRRIYHLLDCTLLAWKSMRHHCELK